MILCLADEGGDGSNDEDEKFRASKDVRGDTKSAYFRILLPSMIFSLSFDDDHTDDAGEQQNGRQREHQEGLSCERVGLVTDGDNEDDE